MNDARHMLREGMEVSVRVRMKYRYASATLARYCGGSQWNVEYDDGEMESRVGEARIARPSGHASLVVKSTSKFAVLELKEQLLRKAREEACAEEDFGNAFFVVANELLRGIHEYGFKKPSALQKSAIPLIYSGKDVVFRASSGTGKTASYVIGILQVVRMNEADLVPLMVAMTRWSGRALTSVPTYQSTILCASRFTREDEAPGVLRKLNSHGIHAGSVFKRHIADFAGIPYKGMPVPEWWVEQHRHWQKGASKWKRDDDGNDRENEEEDGSSAATATAAAAAPPRGQPRGVARTQALILVPTRELACGVSGVFSRVGRFLSPPLAIFTLVNMGTRTREVIMALTEGGGRSLDVVVGTPGLVCDMAARGVLKLDDIRVLMLDDADELLERGFEGVLDNLFKFIRPPNSSLNPNPATPPDSALGPTPVQVCLCARPQPISGLLSNDIKKFVDRYLRDPAEASVEVGWRDGLTLKGVRQYYVCVSEEEKLGTLVDLCERMVAPRRAVIYCNTRRKLDWLADRLAAMEKERGKEEEEEEAGGGGGVFQEVVSMHGGMDKHEVDDTLRRFFAEPRFPPTFGPPSPCSFLITTDLFVTRDLVTVQQLQRVPLVINYDLPMSPEDYLQRVGRSSRGHEGSSPSEDCSFGSSDGDGSVESAAISLITERDDGYVWTQIQPFQTNIRELQENYLVPRGGGCGPGSTRGASGAACLRTPPPPPRSSA